MLWVLGLGASYIRDLTVQRFSFNETQQKMSSVNRWLFCIGLDVWTTAHNDHSQSCTIGLFGNEPVRHATLGYFTVATAGHVVLGDLGVATIQLLTFIEETMCTLFRLLFLFYSYHLFSVCCIATLRKLKSYAWSKCNLTTAWLNKIYYVMCIVTNKFKQHGFLNHQCEVWLNLPCSQPLTQQI